ncbi:DUF3369 domain-containing protein [Aliikangiella sp. G2MR2-5]|uniref:DUF3369 domain-containing protein n=1 Tax=Aliikangiella sp. G2MR2-5 TaxID=2788943 RepID=UPI0018AA4D12|nr:DUF3369 domain-containing protein [Aliikangiella sp. G2MR2-5]
MSDNDELIFADEDDGLEEVSQPPRSEKHWHLLVVDDEPEVHQVTRLALKNFTFQDLPLEIDSAFSAKHAKQVLEENDYAIILLDVVMETDHAGLELVKWIREVHRDQHVRIILRTGQPGQAPEREVIRDYDINDYKEKTELTSNRLFTLMYSGLRSYRDIISLHRNKKGLETIIKGTAKVFAQHSLKELTQGALEQLTALLQISEGAIYGELEGLTATQSGNESQVVAATGKYSNYISNNLEVAVKDFPKPNLLDNLRLGRNQFEEDYFIGFYESHLKKKNILYLEGLPPLSQLDKHLIQIFCNHIGIAFDNTSMFEELEVTQKEIVYRMSEAVENRSKETSHHVKRMAEICLLLGKAIGLGERQQEVLYMAAPLHDIGKVAIPDAILNKPGKLDPEEWEIMKNHAAIGRDILAGSKLEVIQVGSLIAGEHHERWDGNGYPNGKSGKDISVYARIAALADVIDALYNERCYKPAWPLDKILDLLKAEKGKQFDPELVDIVLDKIDDIIAIQNRFPN